MVFANLAKIHVTLKVCGKIMQYDYQKLAARVLKYVKIYLTFF